MTWNEQRDLRHQQPRNSDPGVMVSNGDGDEDNDEVVIDDTAVDHYATPDHQKSLSELIEAQDLPVKRRLVELIKALRTAATERSGMVLLQGETGSGKSIYSPVAMRAALKLLQRRDRVFMLQPRRDAASGVARATAAVMGEELGSRGAVGFSTSEAREIHQRTKVGVVTPGIFIRHMIRGDLDKEKVGAVILDEIHEGSIDYHLALGLLKKMRNEGRAPLTLLTSATLNRQRIQEYFGITNDDYLRIEGRTYPVEKTCLTNRQVFDEEHRRHNYLTLTVQEIERVCTDTDEGDILVFVPGAKEIRTIIQQLQLPSSVEVLPLHGGLQPAERDNALSGRKRHNIQRRVIIATNIAETSVTLPGIRYVVDTGRQRVSRYNPATGITEMHTEWISKDQAEQRAGRAGRITEGACIRIMTEEDFEHLPQHPQSEIMRENLSHLVLRLKHIGIEPETFDFIEPPPQQSIRAAVAELKTLGALDEHGNMTPIGEEISRMPFEPRIGRMLIEAKKRGRLLGALVIAAFEREGRVFLGPTEEEIRKLGKREARAHVQQLQKKFSRGGSDIEKNIAMFYAAVENGVVDAMRHDRTPEGREVEKKFRKWCKEHYLKAEGLMHIAYKLREYARYAGVELTRSKMRAQLDNMDSHTVGAMVLAANPDRMMYLWSEGRGMPGFLLVDDSMGRKEINASPSSDAFDTPPDLCVATTISEGTGTARGQQITRNYAEGIHPITAKQLREIVPHLIAEHREPPTYNAEQDRVVQRVSLHHRTSPHIQFGEEMVPTTGQTAVEVFAQWLTSRGAGLPATAHNRRVLETLQELRARSGGRVTPPNMVEWYRQRLNGASSLREAEALGAALELNREEYCPQQLLEDIDRYAPTRVTIRHTLCPVSYDQQALTATIHLEPEVAVELVPEDIPTIGFPDHPLPVILEVYVKGNRLTASDSVTLQQRMEDVRLQDAWEYWQYDRRRSAITPLPIVPFRPLPSLEDFSAQPVQYASDRNSQPVFAYPGRSIESRYDYTAGTDRYMVLVNYYRTSEEAQRAETEADRKKRDIDETARREHAATIVIENAKQVLIRIERMVESSWYQDSVHEETKYDWEREIQEARQLLGLNRSWGYTQKDPQKALDILTRVEQELGKEQQKAHARSEELRTAESLFAEVQTLVEERLYVPQEWGIPYNEERRLLAEWDSACAAMRTPGSDLTGTIHALRRVEKALQKHQQTIHISYGYDEHAGPGGGFGTLADKLKGVKLKKSDDEKSGGD